MIPPKSIFSGGRNNSRTARSTYLKSNIFAKGILERKMIMEFYFTFLCFFEKIVILKGFYRLFLKKMKKDYL